MAEAKKTTAKETTLAERIAEREKELRTKMVETEIPFTNPAMTESFISVDGVGDYIIKHGVKVKVPLAVALEIDRKTGGESKAMMHKAQLEQEFLAQDR